MIYKITTDLLNKCIFELKKEENKEKININIVDPIIENLSKKLYPYILIVFFMYILIIIIIISILILLISNKK